MGQMKQLMMEAEERVCDELADVVGECETYAEFQSKVYEAYKNDDMLMDVALWDEEYIHDVAAEMWNEKWSEYA